MAVNQLEAGRLFSRFNPELLCAQIFFCFRFRNLASRRGRTCTKECATRRDLIVSFGFCRRKCANEWPLNLQKVQLHFIFIQLENWSRRHFLFLAHSTSGSIAGDAIDRSLFVERIYCHRIKFSVSKSVALLCYEKRFTLKRCMDRLECCGLTS